MSDHLDKEDVMDIIRNHLTIHAHCSRGGIGIGGYEMKITLKLDGRPVDETICPLPSVSDLKSSEYNDW